MSLKGTISGIAKIREKNEARKNRSFNNDGESPFITINDGESIKIRFLQELDTEASTYEDRRGLITVVEEHTNPADFRKRAQCTLEEEGKCWACNQIGGDEVGRKWKPKMRMYANVIVRGTDSTPDRVKILAQGFSKQAIGDDILNIAEEFGALGDKDCRVKREGVKLETSYSILPLAAKALSKADLAHELIDPQQFIKYVSYADQEAFYNSTAEEKQDGNASSW